ncbi:MAG: glycerophosphodiester phosphodiesterase [Planctomycetes bacterium]|nr:glycerophosphodiester phosphodiesterase [Planctomycetota bacterium]
MTDLGSLRAMRIVGHRGAPSHEPENTLRSFARAVELGATAVELDVHLTADRRLAVIHDDAVDRTTNGVGRVADLTLEDVQRLKIAGGERVPSLEEVIEWAAGKVFLHVEVKAPPALRPAVEMLAARGLVGNCRISSFWHRAVKEVKAVCAGMETGVLYSASPIQSARLAIDAGADALHPNWHYVTPELMTEARDKKLKVVAWTVDGAKEIEAMHALGVDELVTNSPDTAVKVAKFLSEKRAAPPREKTAEERAMDEERARLQAMKREKPDEGPRTQGSAPKW